MGKVSRFILVLGVFLAMTQSACIESGGQLEFSPAGGEDPQPTPEPPQSGTSTSNKCGLDSSCTVTLKWDRSRDDIAINSMGFPREYRIYWGSASRSYDHQKNVGSTDTTTLTNLADQIYYITATAINPSTLLESDYSNELVIDPTDPIEGAD